MSLACRLDPETEHSGIQSSATRISIMTQAKSTLTPVNHAEHQTRPTRWQELLELLLLRRKAILAGPDTTAEELPDAPIIPTAESLLRLTERERRELSQVLAAIGRIVRDEYGACGVCEEEIPLSHLRQFPFTRLCTNCQSRGKSYPPASTRQAPEAPSREVQSGSPR